jgi:hypothetical protein
LVSWVVPVRPEHIKRHRMLLDRGLVRWGLWWVVVCWGVGGLLVENCIVDASIFVVKLSRANGGCLGTRSR